MSDLTVDIERREGARPRGEPVFTTGTIGEEVRQAASKERAIQLTGADFYLPLAGQPHISQMRSWRGPIVTEEGNPGIYVQIDEWLPLYKGNVYVVNEVTGRMYLSKKSHLMRIPEMASHKPMEDHELSMSRHIPERETSVMPREKGDQELQYPQDPRSEEPRLPDQGDRPEEGVDQTPFPIAGSTPFVEPEVQPQGTP